MSAKNPNKTGRGLARAQRRLKESAKQGKLQNVATQREAIQKLVPAKEKTAKAA